MFTVTEVITLKLSVSPPIVIRLGLTREISSLFLIGINPFGYVDGTDQCSK